MLLCVLGDENNIVTRGANSMKEKQNIRKTDGILNRKSAMFSLLLAFIFFETAMTVQWEHAVGGDSPGVIITDEKPSCWFSPSHYNASGTVTLSNIQYDSFQRVIEYHATAVSNAYIIETHIYDANYHHWDVTGFKETRFYPASGNTYEIEVSGALYDSHGDVLDGYNVIVNLDDSPILPSKVIDPNPNNGAIDLAAIYHKQPETVRLNASLNQIIEKVSGNPAVFTTALPKTQNMLRTA